VGGFSVAFPPSSSSPPQAKIAGRKKERIAINFFIAVPVVSENYYKTIAQVSTSLPAGQALKVLARNNHLTWRGLVGHN
jgi:hypothetical protein